MTDRQVSCEVSPYREDLWAELEPIWRQVSERTPELSVFQSVPWVASWFAVFGPSLRPSALVWRDDEGAPVGCCLWSLVSDRAGPFRVKQLFLNASGDRKIGCEHNQIVAVPEWRGTVVSDLVERVQREAPDELVLTGFKAGPASELHARWHGRLLYGYSSESPYVCLDTVRNASGDYLSLLSSNTRAKIRRSFRAYEGEFGEALLDVARPEQVAPWFSEMISLHEERWRPRGLPGAFADPLARAFYNRLVASWTFAHTPDDQPRLDLIRIRFGDETIGFLFNLVFCGTVSFYQSGVKYHTENNQFKPGLVMHTLAVRHYSGEGLSEYDFLGGEPTSVQYKRSLATSARELVWHRLPATTAKMRALDALRRGRQALRRSRRTASEG